MLEYGVGMLLEVGEVRATMSTSAKLSIVGVITRNVGRGCGWVC